MALDMKNKNRDEASTTTTTATTATTSSAAKGKRRRIVAPGSTRMKKPEVERGQAAIVMPTPPPSPLVVTHSPGGSGAAGKQYSVLEDITPELADIYLTGNVMNRPLSPPRVAAFARDMIAGKWVVTHQGIAVDSESRLLDGQHRLRAIIASGKTVRMMVSFNVPPAAIHQIDVGIRPRSIADTASMIRGTKRSGQAVAGVKVIAALLDGYEETRIWNASEVFEKLDIFEADLRVAQQRLGTGKLRQASIHAGFAYALPCDREKIEEWGKIVASRINMTPTMAAFERAIEKLIPANTTWKKQALALITMRAIHAHLKGEELSSLYIKSTETEPLAHPTFRHFRARREKLGLKI